MRIIVHLSDLHFGRVDIGLLTPLIERIRSIEPDVVVVSGDLTQRARSAQFIAARAFLDALPQPRVVVPGNHDIPLHNVFDRFARPLDKYRRYITDDMEPAWIDAEIAVLGVNTARSATIKDGRINAEQIERLATRLAALDPDVVKIVVTHHPFDLPVKNTGRDLVGRASTAMRMFARQRVDLLLAGHIHTSHAGDTAMRYPLGGHAALAVQAGTATSTRGRGEANAFNVIRIDGSKIAVDRFDWTGGTHRAWKCAKRSLFVRTATGWTGASGGADTIQDNS